MVVYVCCSRRCGWMSDSFFCLLSDDLFKVHKLKPNLKWRQAFEMYLKTMPPYYLLVNWSCDTHATFSKRLVREFIMFLHLTNIHSFLLLSSDSPWKRHWGWWGRLTLLPKLWTVASVTVLSPTWRSSASRYSEHESKSKCDENSHTWQQLKLYKVIVSCIGIKGASERLSSSQARMGRVSPICETRLYKAQNTLFRLPRMRLLVCIWICLSSKISQIVMNHACFLGLKDSQHWHCGESS